MRSSQLPGATGDLPVAAPQIKFRVAIAGRRRIDPALLTPFARALHDARTAAGWSQLRLANELGIGVSAIGMIESARGPTSAQVLTVERTVGAAKLLGADEGALLHARALTARRFELPNLSEEHAETAVALRAAWARLDTETLARVRAAIADPPRHLPARPAGGAA